MEQAPVAVPASEIEITPSWLSAALLRSYPHATIRSVQRERIGEEYGFRGRIFRCPLEGSNSPRSVVVKLSSLEWPYGGQEVNFYQTIGPRAGIRIPACYLAASDVGNKSAVLILEDLQGTTQGDCLRPLALAGATAVARSIASFHAALWNHPALGTWIWLPSRQASSRATEWFDDRREVFLSRFGERIDPGARDLLENIEAVQGRANERLQGAPSTLLHGDLHLDNFLFERETQQPVLLDWDCCARGPAALDLASALLSIGPLDRVGSLIDAYLEELRRLGVPDSDTAQLPSQLGGALLWKFINATCGVAYWKPEREREVKLVKFELERMLSAMSIWRKRDPDLFRF